MRRKEDRVSGVSGKVEVSEEVQPSPWSPTSLGLSTRYSPVLLLIKLTEIQIHEIRYMNRLVNKEGEKRRMGLKS